MKRILLFTILIISTDIIAQKLRVNGYASYVFTDMFNANYDDGSYYKGDIDGGFQWGAGVELFVRPECSLELLYHRQDTHAPITYQRGSSITADFEDFNMNMNYILLGGNRIGMMGEKVEGYAGPLIGVVIIEIGNETTNKSNTITKFSWGLRFGCNVWVRERIGVKVQGQLLSALQAAGGSAYFGSSGLSSASSIFQFGLGAGVIFKIGNKI